RSRCREAPRPRKRRYPECGGPWTHIVYEQASCQTPLRPGHEMKSASSQSRAVPGSRRGPILDVRTDNSWPGFSQAMLRLQPHGEEDRGVDRVHRAVGPDERRRVGLEDLTNAPDRGLSVWKQ